MSRKQKLAPVCHSIILISVEGFRLALSSNPPSDQLENLSTELRYVLFRGDDSKYCTPLIAPNDSGDALDALWYIYMPFSSQNQ